MAYNRRNLLIKIVEIQEIVIREQKRGTTQLWVYKNLIEPHYHIGYSTFNNYLTIPAKKQLEELNHKAIANKRQLTLAFD
jgi:hypothetical protein